MQLDAILEVAIGLIMLWLILSVATMEIQNWLTQVLNISSKVSSRNFAGNVQKRKGAFRPIL